MIKKIFFLKKIDAPFGIYISFFKYFIFDKFTKPFRDNFQKKHRNLLKNKLISYDWFSKHCFYFYWNIRKIKKKKFKYLEIGVFEGNSFLFVLSQFKSASCYAVDPWINSDDKHTALKFTHNMNVIEKNFDKNLYDFRSNFSKIKKKSDVFLQETQEIFDVIYVDGDHTYSRVLSDAIKSWKLLNKNGVLIFDDYFYHYPHNPRGYVGYAINNFLNKIKKEYKILLVTKNQIFIKKLC